MKTQNSFWKKYGLLHKSSRIYEHSISPLLFGNILHKIDLLNHASFPGKEAVRHTSARGLPIPPHAPYSTKPAVRSPVVTPSQVQSADVGFTKDQFVRAGGHCITSVHLVQKMMLHLKRAIRLAILYAN